MDCRLEQCFHSEVEIDCESKNDADRIYDLVKTALKTHISGNVGNNVTLVDMGSSFENLKVRKPDEYDLMLAVHNTGLQVVSSEVPGFFYIKELYPRINNETAFKSWRWIDFVECMEENFLSPVKVRGSFHSMMHRFLKQHHDSRYTMNMRQSGPAIEVSVAWTGKSMTIDFVPTISIMGDIFVAKPLPCTTYADTEKGELLWRKSFSPQEREFISLHLSENWRKAVMMWKAARLNSAQLQTLSSYHFKIIGMKLAKTRVASSLEDSVTSIGKELASRLQERSLPHIFNSEVNLLSSKSKDSLDNLEKFVTNRLKCFNIVSLIETKKKTDSLRKKILSLCKNHYLSLLVCFVIGLLSIIAGYLTS